MMQKTSVKDMVAINVNEFLKVADKESLRKFCIALGYNRNFVFHTIEKKRIPIVVLDKICKFYGADKNKIIVENPTAPKTVVDDMLDLIVEQNERFDAKLEEVKVKEERDIAELKRIITSLQIQIEQMKNERRLDNE